MDSPLGRVLVAICAFSMVMAIGTRLLNYNIPLDHLGNLLNTGTYMYVCVCVCLCVCVRACVRVCMYVCMYVCITSSTEIPVLSSVLPV